MTQTALWERVEKRDRIDKFGRGRVQGALQLTNSYLNQPIMANNTLKLIRITKETKDKIETLAEERGLKQITTLEYLLSGKINLKDLWNSQT